MWQENPQYQFATALNRLGYGSDHAADSVIQPVFVTRRTEFGGYSHLMCFSGADYKIISKIITSFGGLWVREWLSRISKRVLFADIPLTHVRF